MTPTQQIDAYLSGLPGWQRSVLTRIRTVIMNAEPGLAEEWKWGTPVWSKNGLVCSIGSFKDHVKINVFKGAGIPDPKKIFNAGLEAKNSRSVDIFDGDTVDDAALSAIVRAAAAKNT